MGDGSVRRSGLVHRPLRYSISYNLFCSKRWSQRHVWEMLCTLHRGLVGINVISFCTHVELVCAGCGVEVRASSSIGVGLSPKPPWLARVLSPALLVAAMVLVMYITKVDKATTTSWSWICSGQVSGMSRTLRGQAQVFRAARSD
nr:uncharacterized protein LOC112281238 [Physcomitrium patens]|eukprot:XP_024373288.1 uncharacterized protein LOC112281238 [Physcomitrella patens]